VEEQQKLFTRLSEKLDEIEKDENIFAFIAAIKEMRGQIRNTHEMQAVGDLYSKPLHEHPEFTPFFAFVMGALDEYPDAKGAVLLRMEEEKDRARDL